ncbi:MAG: hypothetical protein K940chlam3_00750 [Chlamydiae bacterium]|nr:hypothetical protein [Chlamydiota bacterium]
MKNFIFILLCVISPVLCQAEPLYLRENLNHAKKGDYLVTVRNKNYTLILINEKSNKSLIIQEITIPQQKFPSNIGTWRAWVESGAPNHTAWVTYKVDLNNGALQNLYSYSHRSWVNISETDNIFTKLINMPFHPLPDRQRRYVGTSDGRRRLWHPRMVVEGQVIPNVTFDAWSSQWPCDQSPLSEKSIQIYIPQDGQGYPNYFPYWMSVRATVGKTQLRIVDSGSGLESPRSFPATI